MLEYLGIKCNVVLSYMLLIHYLLLFILCGFGNIVEFHVKLIVGFDVPYFITDLHICAMHKVRQLVDF